MIPVDTAYFFVLRLTRKLVLRTQVMKPVFQLWTYLSMMSDACDYQEMLFCFLIEPFVVGQITRLT